MIYFREWFIAGVRLPCTEQLTTNTNYIMERLTLIELVLVIAGTFYFAKGFINFIKLTIKGL